jgi:hypothetical protein
VTEQTYKPRTSTVDFPSTSRIADPTTQSPPDRTRSGFFQLPLKPQTPAPPPEMAAYLSMGEAHRRIGDYLSRVVNAISSSDGAALASLVAVSSSPGSTPLSDALAALPDFPRLAGDRYPHLADLLVPLLRAIHSHSLQRFADAYSSFEKAARFVPPPLNPVHSIGFFEDLTLFLLQCIPAGVQELGDAVGSGGDAHGDARNQAASREGERGN